MPCFRYFELSQIEVFYLKHKHLNMLRNEPLYSTEQISAPRHHGNIGNKNTKNFACDFLNI